MATANNNFITGAVLGDLVLGAYNTNNIWFYNANTNTVRMRLDSDGGGTFSGFVSASGPKSQIRVNGNSVGCGISLTNTIVGANRRNWGIFTEENVEGDFVINRSTTSGGSANTTVLSLSRDGAATFSRNDAGNISVTIANAFINQGNLINFQQNKAGSTINAYIGHGGDSSGDFIINNGTQAITIKNGGNVGISQNTPTALLHLAVANAAVDGTKGVKITNPAGTTVMLECGVSSDSFVGTTSASDFSIRTGNSERMRITSGGKVEISIPTLANALKLNGANNYFTQFIKAGSGTGTSYGLTIAAGTNSSDSSFEITNYSESTLYFKVRGDGAMALNIGPYNNTTATSANMFIFGSPDYFIGRSTSSARFKTQIEDIEESYVNNIYKMRPRWYRSLCEKDNKEWSHFGFVAEEMAEIEPRLVHWNKDEEDNIVADGVQYDRITALLVKAIQELESRIKQLENK
jgi:hypothetical protein